MNIRKVEILILSGVGSELLDITEATANYEMSGDGALLLDAEDIPEGSKVKDIINQQNYEGLVLLRK